MSQGQHVLVVDGLEETEEVLKAVLEPRGHKIDRVRGHEPPVERAAPQLVVIDLDEHPQPALERGWGNAPRILIGTLRDGRPRGDDRILAKPFHYRELIQAVEQLLADRAA